MRTWTLTAPAFFSIWIRFAIVVPRTIESSTNTIRFPFTTDSKTLSLRRTLFSPLFLSRFDKSPAYIAVFIESKAEGDS